MKKKLLKHTGMMLLSLACCLTSCIKEDYASSSDTASVTLTFTTRANGTDSESIDEGEGMKHLRVIVADSETGEVRFNYTHEFTGDELNNTTHKVTFGDLYAERTYDFYAIANEQSFGGNFDGKDIDVSAVYATTLTQTAGTLIDVSNRNYLPAAEKASLEVKAEANQSLTITMKRVVAKAKVTFVNETGADQTISDVKIVKAGAKSTSLFPPADATLPTATEDLSLGSVSVSADATASTPAGYFYESASTDGYVLQATWNNQTKTLSLADEDESISQISRNEMLNITITLKENDWKLNYEIVEWEDHEVNVDFTDNLSYTSDGWTDGTYLSLRENNTVHLNPDVTAELKFTIMTPSGATWVATLEGDVNDFEFVDGSNSGSAWSGGNPVKQSIKIKVVNSDSDETHRATLRVVAFIGGNTYELDLTNSEGSQDAINRFTLLQSR